MNNLPTEILHKIFIKLDLQQRLVCLRVCHKWWHVLEGRCLYYDIEIDEFNEDQFKAFMATFRTSPSLGNQVNKLYVMLNDETNTDRREFINMFPNVRVLNVFPSWRTVRSDEVSYFDHPFDTTLSNSRVESLADFNHCELMSQMLHSNLCNQLKELELNLYFISGTGTPPILHQLRNLPLLTKLYLHVTNITLGDLEVIHTNIPTVEVFILDNIVVRAGNIPSNIQPASSIKNLILVINDAAEFATHIQVYRYLYAKYTSLTVFEYLDKKRFGYDAAQNLILSFVIEAFCNTLKENGCEILFI